MQRLVVFGAGGHAKVVLDALALTRTYEVAGLIGKQDEVGHDLLGVPVIATKEGLGDLAADGIAAAVIGIGSVGDVVSRIESAEAARGAGLDLPAIVHPAAVVSPHAVLSAGVFVAAGAIVGPGAHVGECAIVNSGSIIDHDCVIGEFAHIAPGAVLSGGVRVGDRTHVGTGTSIVQYRNIGSDVLLGAGSVVVSDIDSSVVAFGNPARIVRNRM